MEKTDALAALAALAQENRLDVFRLLVRAGPNGLPAGEVATALRLPPNTLTFHFDRLRMAGLVTVRRDGSSWDIAPHKSWSGRNISPKTVAAESSAPALQLACQNRARESGPKSQRKEICDDAR